MKYMAAEEEKYWTSPNGTKCEILPEEIEGLRRIMQQASIDREKIERIADPKTRRIKQEEYWADLNEAIWENKIIAWTNENERLSKEIEQLSKEIELLKEIERLTKEKAELRRLLQQAGIEIPQTK